MLLGDMIAGVTKFFGVQPCEPCKARQAALNRLHQRVMGVSPQDARTTAIRSIQCPVCRNYAWAHFMNPERDAAGALHHPGCDAKAFVIETRRV